MAYIVLTSNQTNLCKVVFKNLTVDNAIAIANRMNGLAEITAKKTAGVIKLTYKVLGK